MNGLVNNLYIFPAVGMAVYATNAKRVSDEMFIEAAHAVADQCVTCRPSSRGFVRKVRRVSAPQ